MYLGSAYTKPNFLSLSMLVKVQNFAKKRLNETHTKKNRNYYTLCTNSTMYVVECTVKKPGHTYLTQRK